MRTAMQKQPDEVPTTDTDNKENKEDLNITANTDVQKSPVERKIKTETKISEPQPSNQPEIDDVPLPTSKPKSGGETPSWDEYMKQIQEEEARNPTPVETKPAATRKPAVTKIVEAKPVDPEEEEKKKKRLESIFGIINMFL
jgi:hypothetical protein